MIALRRTAAALAALAATAAVVSVPAQAVAESTPAAGVVSGTEACLPLRLSDLDVDQARAYAEEVGFVFVGRVLDRQQVGPSDPQKRQQPPVERFEHTVTIVSALQGDVENVVTVVTDTSSDTGFGRLRTRSEYLFFADEVDTEAGALTASRRFAVEGCSGTTRLTGALGTGLERELQRALMPEPPRPGVEVDFTEPAGGASEPPSLSRAVAPGIAIGLVGILGLLLLSRVGRRV